MANGQKNGITKQSFKALESTLHDAFSYAQDSRKLHGIPLMKSDVEISRSGLKRIGPAHYKTTVWWAPWEFVDLLRQKEAEKFLGGLTTYIKHLALSSVPTLAARPAKALAPGEKIKLRLLKGKPSKAPPVSLAARRKTAVRTYRAVA